MRVYSFGTSYLGYLKRSSRLTEEMSEDELYGKLRFH